VTRVAVIGCGAIGSLYAAHLARVPGVEVWAVDPWAEHVDAIGSRGLRVTGLADFTAEIRASTDGRDLPACDFGLVATKALHTRAAVAGARTALAGAAVVSVQNGLGNEEVIAELVPRVIRGSIITAGRTEVTALGDEVNEAARIEACAVGGRLLASKLLLEQLDSSDAASFSPALIVDTVTAALIGAFEPLSLTTRVLGSPS